MTCIGNSGPLPPAVAKAIGEGSLVAAAVLSGNRNFEGRIHPLTKANYLASPPLVVAYALAGTVDIDLTSEPLGIGRGRPARVLEGHLAQPRRNRRGGFAFGSAGDVPLAIFRRVRGERNVESHRGFRKRAVPVGSRQHVHPGTAVPGRCDRRAGTDPSDPRRPRVGDVRRFGDDRPHFAGRLDRRDEPRRQVPARARRRAGGFQQLRIAPRQRSGDVARHVRQHSHPQPACPGQRRGRDSPLARRPVDAHLRRGDEIQGRRGAAADPRRGGIWHRQQPRLGRQGPVPAWASAPPSLPASNASTAATWWAWASCRCNFPSANRGNRWG